MNETQTMNFAGYAETDLFGQLLTAPKKQGQRGYAARPGGGPAGKTCRQCSNYCRVQGGARRWPKCLLMRHAWTHGSGSDIKAGAPACELFNKKSLAESLTA